MKNELAKQIDWPLPWTSSVYTPEIITDGDRVFLVYGVREIPRFYDTSTLKVIGDEKSVCFTAVVEFLGWLDFKFGKLDEDVIGNPNYIEGLEPYKAYKVQNSKWLDSLKEVIPSKSVSDWNKYHHFVLGFHDTRFECIARSYYIEAYDSEDVFETIYDRITGEEWWMKGTKTDLCCLNCKTYLGKHFYANFCRQCGEKLAPKQ